MDRWFEMVLTVYGAIALSIQAIKLYHDITDYDDEEEDEPEINKEILGTLYV